MPPNKEGRECSEESVKETDNLFNLANKMVEQWNERLALSRPSLLKRYVKGEFALVIRVRCTLPERESVDYCAVFERANGFEVTKGGAFKVNVSFEGDNVSAHGAPDDVQEAVLIPDIEFVDDIDGMGLVAESFCDVVRLQKFDDLQSRFADSRFLFRAGYFGSLSSPAFGFPGNRELRLPSVRIPPVNKHQLSNQQVQGRAQVVDDFSGYDSPSQRGVLGDADFKNLLSRLRVRLRDNAVGVEVHEGPDFGIEVTDMFFGPFDLRPRTIKGGVHG